MIPEMRAFASDSLKVLSSAKWNREGSDNIVDEEELRDGILGMMNSLDKFLCEDTPFEMR